MTALAETASQRTAKKRTLEIAMAIACLFTGAASISADVPNDLVDAVEYQKRNKPKLIAKLQQRAVFQRQQKNNDGAKETKRLADAVRANKALVLPPLGEAGNLPGTIIVEQVIEKTDTGYRIDTSLPKLEPRGGVNIRTGQRTVRPELGSEFIYYPQRIYIETTRELKKDEQINVRRTESGYAEIPADEINQAAELLKQK